MKLFLTVIMLLTSLMLLSACGSSYDIYYQNIHVSKYNGKAKDLHNYLDERVFDFDTINKTSDKEYSININPHVNLQMHTSNY